MLIILDETLESSDFSAEPLLCAGMSSILDAAFRGEHFIFGLRSTLRFLAQNAALSFSARDVAAKTLSNFSLMGAIPDLVSHQVRIVINGSDQPSQTDPTRWTVPLEFIGKHGLGKSLLLAENLDDTKIFVFAAKHYKITNKLPGDISLDFLNGGGSTTPSSFRESIEQQRRWCCCITDSDRVFPGASMCHTASECARLSRSSGVVAEHRDLDEREVENFIPLKFVGSSIAPQQESLWTFFIDTFIPQTGEAHRFADLKNGIKRIYIEKKNLAPAARDYWATVNQKLQESGAVPGDCPSGKSCLQPDVECSCVLSPAFGNSMISRVLTFLNTCSAHKSEELIRNDLNRNQWLEIGKLVYEWALAQKPVHS